MQLMAGVKCCTGRPITNHPHFEDKSLREATKKVFLLNFIFFKIKIFLNFDQKKIYQIYALREPDFVYDILKHYNANYVIIENSLCYSLNKPNNCSLKEILDKDNQHVSNHMQILNLYIFYFNLNI